MRDTSPGSSMHSRAARRLSREDLLRPHLSHWYPSEGSGMHIAREREFARQRWERRNLTSGNDVASFENACFYVCLTIDKLSKAPRFTRLPRPEARNPVPLLCHSEG